VPAAHRRGAAAGGRVAAGHPGPQPVQAALEADVIALPVCPDANPREVFNHTTHTSATPKGCKGCPGLHRVAQIRDR